MTLGATRAVLLGAGGSSAGTQYAVGSFTKNTATGTQAVTGVGFTPKAIIFWTSGSAAASGTWSGDIYQTLGFTAGASNSYAVGGFSDDANGTSDTSRRMAAKAITMPNSAGSGTLFEADLSSFDADGFTLNWTTNTTPASVVMFIAIGGADVQAKVVNWQTPTATGNKAVTGAGFQPDLVLHAHVGALSTSSVTASGTFHEVGFGAMNSAGEQWANAILSVDNTPSADTQRGQRTDSCIVDINGSLGFDARATYVSMDADGFTVNYATTHGLATYNLSLCLKGVTSKVGSFNKTTAAAPASQSVNAGMEPKAVLFSHIQKTAVTTPDTWAIHGIGAYDGATNRGAAQMDQDGQDPTAADSLFSSTAAVLVPGVSGTTPTTAAAGAGTGFTATGFDMSFNPNDATAYQILYLALR